MKKLLVLSLISFSLLFQSCSSYKSIDYDSGKPYKYQKIRVVMVDGTKYNGRLFIKDEQNLYISTRDGKTLKIPKVGINELKTKEFNVLKTFGFTVGYIALVGLGGYGIYSFLAAIASTG
jgi:hypothetical protein